MAGRDEQPCRAKLERPEGFRTETRKGLAGAKVGMRRVAHTAIDGQWLRAKSGEFHSSTVLAAGQRLEGYIEGDGAGAAVLSNWAKGGKLRIQAGRGRSRGQGSLSVRLAEAPRANDLASRVKAWNQQARAKFPGGSIGAKAISTS